MLKNTTHMNIFGYPYMVPSNGMHFIYIFNVQLNLLLSNILFNIYYYIMLRGPQGCHKSWVIFWLLPIWNDVCTSM